MLKHRQALYGCGHPLLCHQRAVVHFIIFSDGQAKLIEVKTGAEALPPELLSCLRREIAAIRFPSLAQMKLQPTAGGSIRVAYPLLDRCAEP